MMNFHVGDQVQRYAAVNDIILTTYGQKCLDASYESQIKQMRQISWNASAAVGGRQVMVNRVIHGAEFRAQRFCCYFSQWTYQTCVEFGFYQTTDSDEQPFGRTIPIDFFVKKCKDIFGDQFNQDLLNESVYNTNVNYGGYNYAGSRVVFVNGEVDPW